VEASIGNPDRLFSTAIGKALEDIKKAAKGLKK
jgi:hypothetical protein